MALRERLNEALKDSMLKKDMRAVSTIRMALAAVKDADIANRTSESREGINDAGVMGVLQGMIKKRRDSIALYEQGGRKDLAEQEAGEIAVLEKFLPQQMDQEGMKKAIQALIAETGTSGIKDMGRVMAELKTRHAGQMDFGQASGMVKTLLSGQG
ncbi:MAG: GatB/YqeY domain-containing protein [Pseudomonadota bacterium]|nr:GatB/YqeY domain-containing protein [Pseudomonadota bacterium]